MRNFEIFIPFEKSVSADGELRLFGGIASSSSVDRDLERMDKAVLPKIAEGLKKNSTVFFNHDTKGLGVGNVVNAEVRGDSVYVDVVPTRAPGMQDVVVQIKEGILKSFSVGGRILDWENQFDDALGKNVRVIKDVDCYEVSVVGVPSNKDASVLSYITKSFEGENMDVKKELGQIGVSTPATGPAMVGSNGPAATAAAESCVVDCAPPMEISKGKYEVTVKCAKCGAVNKGTYERKEDPEQGPHEDGKKSADLLESPEFKKVFDEFGNRVSTLEKSHKAKIEEYDLALKAAQARIDELHKSIDSKSKALETETDNLQKSVKETEKAPESKGSFRLFPEGKAY
jgi:HK97 family phage prohead protease